MESRDVYRPLVYLVACFGLCFLLLGLLPASGFTEETYRYKRMWPTLPQPWYFGVPIPGGYSCRVVYSVHTGFPVHAP